MSDAKIPVIIDCDPGHDDAIALLLAFGSKTLQVLGVTTVAGNSTGKNTYHNAVHFLSFLDLKTKVAKGADKPLLRPLITSSHVHGKTGLDGFYHKSSGLKHSGMIAFDFITETLLSSKQKITLIPVGPLTNIAIALLAKPEIKTRIERIVLMGGAALEGNQTPSAEFNILTDPEAAKIVFESGVPITMVGLDVTHKAVMYLDEVEALRKLGKIGDILARMLDFYGVSYRDRLEGIPIHDALAVAAVIEPEILVTRHLNVSVETSGELTLGRTVVDFRGITGKTPNCDVALDVDRETFSELIFHAVRTFIS